MTPLHPVRSKVLWPDYRPGPADTKKSQVWRLSEPSWGVGLVSLRMMPL